MLYSAELQSYPHHLPLQIFHGNTEVALHQDKLKISPIAARFPWEGIHVISHTRL